MKNKPDPEPQEVDEELIGKWRCEMCGEIIPITELHPYGGDFVHTVPEAVDDGRGGCYPEPSPCGPVRQLPSEVRQPSSDKAEGVDEVYQN